MLLDSGFLNGGVSQDTSSGNEIERPMRLELFPNYQDF
jgi:hypothetical protein